MLGVVAIHLLLCVVKLKGSAEALEIVGNSELVLVAVIVMVLAADGVFLVNGAVAIVVSLVAQLFGELIDLGIFVVAVTARRVPVPVNVIVQAVLDTVIVGVREPLIDASETVVINGIAQFINAGIDEKLLVVAVPA